MASGEMSDDEFVQFLQTITSLLTPGFSLDGSAKCKEATCRPFQRRR
jgi:hypothetical protein